MKYRIMLFFVLVLGLTGCSRDRIQFSEVRPPFKSVSPAITRLESLDRDSFAVETEKLLEELKTGGSPLIEKNPLDEDYLYLTFIHRESGVDKDVHKVLDAYNSDRIPKGDERSYSYSVLDLRKTETDWNTRKYEDTGSVLDTFVFKSKKMKNSRNVYVYLPLGYDPRKKPGYPVIYLFDSPIYLNRVEVPHVLNNLITEGRIEPMIAVMIDNPTKTSRFFELPLNFEFKDFIIEEFLPEIRGKYNTSLNPEENIIGGMSYGGLAAAFIAFDHPDVFGKVLSQSGSFWRDLKLTDPFGTQIRNDWLINRFAAEKARNLKIFLDWGLQEKLCMGSGRKMVRVLDKKGYDFKFMEFDGWHDWSNSRKTFPIGLMYLLE
jgi:enterochelin esterase family protein